MLRLLLSADCFLLSPHIFLTFFFSQHFIQSDMMEDGQETGVYAPDRAEDDPSDVEYVGNFGSSDSADDEESSGESTDSDDLADDDDPEAADARDADAGATARGGTHDPSFEQFLAEWSDDDDDDGLSHIGDSDAAPHAKPPKAPIKRALTTSSSTGAESSKVAKTAPTASKSKR